MPGAHGPRLEHGSEPAVVVLAGGEGSRLGGRKHEVRVGGRRLLDRSLEAALGTGLPTYIAAKEGVEVEADVARIAEPARPHHPLLGITCALRALAPAPIVAVACDMPFLPSGYLSWLAGIDGQAVVPVIAGRPQPLAARFEFSALPALEDALAATEPVRCALSRLSVTWLKPSQLDSFGDPGFIFYNVNSPLDRHHAERMAQEADRYRPNAGT